MVARGIAFAEGLAEQVGVRRLGGAVPIEEQVAGLRAGSLGEPSGDLEPGVGELGLDVKTDIDKDNGPILPRPRGVVEWG